MDSDPARLLHRRSEHGYTDVPALALPQEPEAVSRAEQRRLTEESRRTARERTQAEWAPYRLLFSQLLDEVETHPSFARARDDFRALRRTLDRVGSSL